MEKNVSVVIGTNYGDEGKGLTTEYLVHRAGRSTAVVRFNGGAQAGHTVQLPDGRRHIFHHFGAGSFSGAATILSKFFVVNPNLFFKEAQEIYKTTSLPKKLPQLDVYIDHFCRVTTPYDVYINQALENSRGEMRHGSCGVGFGETIEREDNGYGLEMSDIAKEGFEEKVERIRDEWLPKRLATLGLCVDHPLTMEVFDAFIYNCKQMLKVATVCHAHDAMEHFSNLIFEGAQGLRLDQDSDDFPHVTRSNTGLKYPAYLLRQIKANITVYYVTRAYLTRHGAGPLKDEIPAPNNIVDKTNVPNDYQGTLRFAILDTDTIAKNVQKDKKFLGSTAFSTVGVITCCDQIESGKLPEIIDAVSAALGTSNILTSFGPTREHITSHTLVGNDAVLC